MARRGHLGEPGGSRDADDDDVALLSELQEDGLDPDLADLQHPDISNLNEPTRIGGRSIPSNSMFGRADQPAGRATSPPLFAAASQFPSVAQLNVWKLENGVPTHIGRIDARATDEEFISRFYASMPDPGDGKATFLLRPINIRGQEIGQEFSWNVSDQHITLLKLHSQKKVAEEGNGQGNGQAPYGWPYSQEGHGSGYAEEIGNMYAAAAEAQERTTQHLQERLEQDRDELRRIEAQRAEERVNSAERASGVVEKMTERMMATDKLRADEAMTGQKEQSQLVLSTLTTVFSQQQQAAREAAERRAEVDDRKAEQDRIFFERQRQEAEDRRQRERTEADLKITAATAEFDRRRLSELTEFERKMALAQQEAEARRQQERTELELRRDQLREEREERERRDKTERDRAQLEWERRILLDREEREKREAEALARFEREKREAADRIEERRRDDEKRDQLRREEESRREERRKEELALQLKQIELAAIRDRDHAAHMMEHGRLEREAQRESVASREKADRESREFQEHERTRKHEMAMKELELSREKDREYQERLMQYNRQQSGGGLGGLVDTLGMEAPELLSRIFGSSGGEGGGGWADAIPKVLAGLAEVGKVVLTAPPPQPKALEDREAKSAREVPAITSQSQRPMIAIQTADGSIKLIPAESAPMMGLPVPPGYGEQPPLTQEDLDEMDELEPQILQPRPQPQPKAPVRPAKVVKPEPAEAVKLAKAAGISLSVQRDARRAVRDLIVKLEKAPEADWPGLVVAALVNNPTILPYVQAVALETALDEARVSKEMAERIMTAIKQSEAVPEGTIPFTEADLVKPASAIKEKP